MAPTPPVAMITASAGNVFTAMLRRSMAQMPWQTRWSSITDHVICGFAEYGADAASGNDYCLRRERLHGHAAEVYGADALADALVIDHRPRNLWICRIWRRRRQWQ